MMYNIPRNAGWIEVICGSMFSGKTEELIRRIRRAQIAKQKTVLFKPRIDDRYSNEQVISHDQRKIDAIPARDAADIARQSYRFEVIGIDETQFFGMPLLEVCQDLADGGKRVIVSGLDQDFRGIPFEPIPQLLAIAEHITKIQAICVVCGNAANRTQRLTKSTKRVLIGGNEKYEARCRRCHDLTLSIPEEDTLVKVSSAEAMAK